MTQWTSTCTVYGRQLIDDLVDIRPNTGDTSSYACLLTSNPICCCLLTAHCFEHVLLVICADVCVSFPRPLISMLPVDWTP